MTLTSSTALIHCRDIEVVFGAGKHQQTVLNGLDLDVDSGQILSLLGPSGCGKSTLLRVIAGLIPPTQGTVLTDHMPPEKARDRMAFVFQEAALLPWRTVYQNVKLPLEINPPSDYAASRQQLEQLLATVGFQQADWNKYPSQLSGGMKMRASIARALVRDPSILLLDEPFAALDDMLRSKLNDLLLQIATVHQRATLFVTHSISEAIYLSHKIAIMSRGTIAQWVTVPLEFPRHAGMRSTAEFGRFYGQVAETLARSNA